MNNLNIDTTATDEQIITRLLEVIFSKDQLIPFFVEALQGELDKYDDDWREKSIETLEYWNEGEDFRGMDKLTLIARYAKMP